MKADQLLFVVLVIKITCDRMTALITNKVLCFKVHLPIFILNNQIISMVSYHVPWIEKISAVRVPFYDNFSMTSQGLLDVKSILFKYTSKSNSQLQI